MTIQSRVEESDANTHPCLSDCETTLRAMRARRSKAVAQMEGSHHTAASYSLLLYFRLPLSFRSISLSLSLPPFPLEMRWRHQYD